MIAARAPPSGSATLTALPASGIDASTASAASPRGTCRANQSLARSATTAAFPRLRAIQAPCDSSDARTKRGEKTTRRTRRSPLTTARVCIGVARAPESRRRYARVIRTSSASGRRKQSASEATRATQNDEPGETRPSRRWRAAAPTTSAARRSKTSPATPQKRRAPTPLLSDFTVGRVPAPAAQSPIFARSARISATAGTLVSATSHA